MLSVFIDVIFISKWAFFSVKHIIYRGIYKFVYSSVSGVLFRYCIGYSTNPIKLPCKHLIFDILMYKPPNSFFKSYESFLDNKQDKFLLVFGPMFIYLLKVLQFLFLILLTFCKLDYRILILDQVVLDILVVGNVITIYLS